MKVQDVKTVLAAENLLQHREKTCVWITDCPVQAQRTRGHSHKLCPGFRLPACEQCDIMANADKLFGQERHNALSPPIQPRRYSFNQRSYLRDTHPRTPFITGRVLAESSARVVQSFPMCEQEIYYRLFGF